MHTVRHVSDKQWVVQFVEAAAEAGYRPTRDNIAWFDNFFEACGFASFLNGGESAGGHGITHFIGKSEEPLARGSQIG
jgi:hypothetical protein